MTRPYEVQWRRGSTSDHEAFVGLPAEITINSDNWEARVHDTAGGHRVAKADLSNVLSGSSFENALLERVIEEIISRGIGSGEGAAVASIGATTKAWASPGADWLPLRGGDVSQAEWPELYENIGDQFAMESSSFLSQTGIIVNTTSPTNQNMNEIAASGETVVIVGASGSIWTTTNNGRNWTVQTVISSSTAFLSVIHGNGLFVAMSATAIITSPDGLTWTQQTTTATAMQTLRFVNGAFVIFSSTGGQVTSSTDGVAWTTRTHTGFSSNTPRDLTFFAGLFVTVGNGGRISTSTDLTAWTDRTSGTTQNLVGITHNGSIAVVVGGATTTSVTLSSVDGIAWTTRTNAAAQARTCVLWSPSTSRFWSGGNAGVYITSTDGITWVTLASTVVNDTSVPNQLYEFNGILFIGMTSSTQPARSSSNGGTSFSSTGRAGNRITATANGTFWFVASGAVNVTRSWPNDMSRLYGILGAANSFVSASSYNPVTNTMLVKASGGWALTTVGSNAATLVMTGAGQSSGTMTGYFNGTWIAGGQGNNFAYSTDNGTTWTAIFLPAPTSSGLRHVAYDGTTWVLTGDIVFAGPDLENLVQVPTTGNNFLAPIRSETMWAIPAGTANTPSVLTSTDGVNWTQRSGLGNISFNATLFGGTYGDGRFVLVGAASSGLSFMSTDGVNWIASQGNAVPGSTSGYFFRSVVYGNGFFVAVGGNASSEPGVVAVSSDGVAWYVRSVGANLVLNTVHYHLGTFFAHSTNAGDLFVSPNGTTWTRRGAIANANTRPVELPSGLIVYGSSGVVGAIRTTVVPGTFRLPFVEPLNQFDPPSWIKAR